MVSFARIIAIALTLLSVNRLNSQVEDDDTIYGIVLKPVVEITDPEFQKNYRRMVFKMRRIYPLALHAKHLFENYEKDIATLDKSRQIKKYGKLAHEKLLEDFEYIVRDMYVSDGQLLVKLIHRETGYTVFEIIKKYRGGLQANWYQGVGKFFDQNIKTEYAPDKEDWLIEYVAKEFEAGKHKLEPIQLLSKEDYLKKKKKHKEVQRQIRKDKKARDQQREKSS